METPTIETLRAAGYRVSVNLSSDLVSRLAGEVARDYLLHYVTSADIGEASGDSPIGTAWRSLLFVSLLQATEFATRTGGERKALSYGEHLSVMRTAKAQAAATLRLLAMEWPRKTAVVDSLELYYKTQLMH